MKRHNGQKMVNRNKKRRHENENASDGARKKKNVFEKNHFFNCGETINLGRWRILDNSNLYFEKNGRCEIPGCERKRKRECMYE